jgi:hypothetical protein
MLLNILNLLIILNIFKGLTTNVFKWYFRYVFEILV